MAFDLAQAGTDSPAERQRTAPVLRHGQRPKVRGIALLRHPADDDEIAAAVGAHLQPVVAAAFRVGRIGALADHAFEAELGHGVKGLDAVAFHVVGEAQRPRFRQQGTEQALAFQQRQPLQVRAASVEQIECVDGHRVVPRRQGRRPYPAHCRACLQKAETRPPLGVVNDHLAIDRELVAGQAARALHDFRETRRQVDAASRTQSHLLAGAFDEQPIAVVLDLEDPAVAVERRRRFGEHGRFGERHGSRRLRAEVVNLVPKGGFDHGGFRQFVHGEAREHGPLRQRLLPRPLIRLLDEQPLLAGVLPPLQRNQREAPTQLVALQLE